MIEAIADMAEKAGKNSTSQSEKIYGNWFTYFADYLRSLARGGGEEKEITFKPFSNLHEALYGPIHFCTEHPCKKRDEEIADMYKSGGKLEYVDQPVTFSPAQVEAIKKVYMAEKVAELDRGPALPLEAWLDERTSKE